ncbi:hypothetical protein GCM10011344_41070 [Dokdonia pacifica]|uniref:Uncharacterized protein n=1 Tax=Dokdonia pacifica TaxID=1627892 RepID=A0A239ABM9_9FLAO|nr:hypothetical protein [Dokdonia pacifica]GGG35946.1 hypothetical protein GCM10011344_41070 [Dokdonia pacifica]SNR92792.1 hypothetical protein SAMN06265376_104293 [Dokdonia pacifica]
MYRLQEIKPSVLRGIPITNEQEIIHQTGSPLRLEDGYALIKKQTEHFTIDDPLAKEADRLLFELVEKHRKNTAKEPIKRSKSKVTPLLSKEAIQIRENERLRAIRLLKLKLTLTPKSA